MKYCPECGTQLNDDALFCRECGHKFENVNVQKSNVNSGSNQTSTLNIPKLNLKSINKKTIIVAAVVVLAVIAGILFFTRKPTLDLNDYITVTYDGFEGEGQAYLEFDNSAFALDVNTNKSTLYDNYREFINVSLEPNEGLSTGDEVKTVWKVNDKQFTKLFGIKLKHKQQSYVVEGLKQHLTADIELDEGQIAYLVSIADEYMSYGISYDYTDLTNLGYFYGEKFENLNNVFGVIYRMNVRLNGKKNDIITICMIDDVSVKGDKVASATKAGTVGQRIKLDGSSWWYDSYTTGYSDASSFISDFNKYAEGINLIKSGEAFEADFVEKDNQRRAEEKANSLGSVEILADELRTRSWASLQAPINGHVYKGSTYEILGVFEADGYTWYGIGDELYIAAKEGKWTKFIDN